MVGHSIDLLCNIHIIFDNCVIWKMRRFPQKCFVRGELNVYCIMLHAFVTNKSSGVHFQSRYITKIPKNISTSTWHLYSSQNLPKKKEVPHRLESKTSHISYCKDGLGQAHRRTVILKRLTHKRHICLNVPCILWTTRIQSSKIHPGRWYQWRERLFRSE